MAHGVMGIAFTFLIVRPAVATDTPPDGDAQLQEVVVSAQRRQEKLRDVPISAQVISDQELLRQNLNSLADLSQTVPSVHVGSAGRSTLLYIRGIGSSENQAFDQSVGTFIDDIYHGRSRVSAATFLDLDRVEVLKGPQSTFFGNNAIAGAFNIVTKRPGNTFDASTRALYGEAGQYAAEGAVGGPIGDRISARAAVTFNGMSGWLKNVGTGQYQPKENNLAGRLTVLFEPTDNLDATVKIEGSKNRNDSGFFLQDGNCPPQAPFVPAGFCSTAIASGLPTGINSNRNATNGGQRLDLDTTEYVLTANYRRWGQTFTSVSGYYRYRFNMNLDTDGTPLTLLNAQAPEHYNQFSQELRIASPTDQTIEYLGGLYLQTDRLFFRQDTGYFFLTPVVAGIPPLARLIPYLPLGQSIDFSQPEHTYSAFGSVTWNLTGRWKLGAGLRGSWVNKAFHWNLLFGTAAQDYGGVVPLPASVAPLANALGLGTSNTLWGTRSDRAWLPSAKIQYRVDPETMVYFSYAKGFKAGGFNGADNSGVAANLPFGPEHVDAYEVGLKSEWLHDTVLLNLAVFRSDYNDLQVSENVTAAAGAFVSVVKNAASSRSQGVELETQWAVSRNFHLSANASYDDAHYVSYPNVSPTQLQELNGLSVQDLSGRPTQFAPKWSGNLTGAYRAVLGAGYQLTTELTTLFSSSFFLSATDDPTARQASYVRLDGRLSLATQDNRWVIDLIGKNLTNHDIAIFAVPWPLSLGSTFFQKEQSRNVALQLRYHW